MKCMESTKENLNNDAKTETNNIMNQLELEANTCTVLSGKYVSDCVRTHVQILFYYLLLIWVA